MIVMVTGATSGLGYAIAYKFAIEGHQVIAIGRRIEKLRALQQAAGENIYVLALDVCQYEKNISLLKKIPTHLQQIDVLVNNAGLALGLDLAYKANIEDWEKMIETNIKGLVNMTHCILPHMITVNRGHIVNISSTAANWPYPGGNVYGASKAFVKQFSLGLRADLMGTAIRVTDIEPGLVDGTEFSVIRYKGDINKAKQTYSGTRALYPEDIAESVYWATTLPSHVNINTMEIMPICQTFSPLTIVRDQ